MGAPPISLMGDELLDALVRGTADGQPGDAVSRVTPTRLDAQAREAG
jgi:hypothetical protein